MNKKKKTIIVGGPDGKPITISHMVEETSNQPTPKTNMTGESYQSNIEERNILYSPTELSCMREVNKYPGRD
jgi:hypothetical protein